MVSRQTSSAACWRASCPPWPRAETTRSARASFSFWTTGWSAHASGTVGGDELDDLRGPRPAEADKGLGSGRW